jgi:hypothetical protein
MERVVRFHRQFPDKRITPYQLRKVYYQHGIKKKKILKTKIISAAHKLKINKEALIAKEHLIRFQERNYHIIYVDEFCITKSTIPTHDWTPRNATFEIDYKLYHKKTLASILSISKDGPELIMTFEKSVTSEKFILFLRALRKKHPHKKLVLFFDQLRVHFSKKCQPVYEELGIEYILNSSYSPNFNASEGAISCCKS